MAAICIFLSISIIESLALLTQLNQRTQGYFWFGLHFRTKKKTTFPCKSWKYIVPHLKSDLWLTLSGALPGWDESAAWFESCCCSQYMRSVKAHERTVEQSTLMPWYEALNGVGRALSLWICMFPLVLVRVLAPCKYTPGDSWLACSCKCWLAVAVCPFSNVMRIMDRWIKSGIQRTATFSFQHLYSKYTMWWQLHGQRQQSASISLVFTNI